MRATDLVPRRVRFGGAIFEAKDGLAKLSCIGPSGMPSAISVIAGEQKDRVLVVVEDGQELTAIDLSLDAAAKFAMVIVGMVDQISASVAGVEPSMSPAMVLAAMEREHLREEVRRARG